MKFEHYLTAYWWCVKNKLSVRPKKTGMYSWEV